MSKLRKSLKKTYSVFIKPSDEAIDWKATAKKLTEDKEYFSVIKDIAFPDEELENVKNKFINNVNKLNVYDYYAIKKFDSDIIVSKEDVPVLKYVFEDFNLTDLNILFDSVQGLKSLAESIKGKEISSQNVLEVIFSLLENKETKTQIFELLKLVMDAKLVKCLGVDEGISKQEIIEETLKELTPQDIRMLFKFVQQSLKLDIEKKNIL